MKTLTCREHGGTFQVVPSRGRPPVKCGGKHPACSRAGNADKLTPAEQETVQAVSKLARAVRKLTPEQSMDRARRDSAAIRGSSKTAPDEERIRAAESNSEPRKPANPSVAEAMKAKAFLEPLGWKCNGRGFIFTPNPEVGEQQHAELTAVRGSELLVLYWVDGECLHQDYTLWNVDKPSDNSKPADRLSFNVDECTDRELIRALSGMKVTWWNRLGQKEETAVIEATRIEIVHAYDGKGDEMPGDRIVKFSDRSGTGFRAFRVGALLEVG